MGYLHLQGKAASDYLRARKARKAAKVPQVNNIQFGFYEGTDGQIVKAVTGAWLGSIELFKQPDGTYAGEGEFRGKKYPIVAEIAAQGNIPIYQAFRYNEQVLDPMQPVVNFMPFLEDYRAERLTADERAFLSACTLADTHDADGSVIKGLHSIQKDFFNANLGNWVANWTPLIDAVNSIMQSDNGMNEDFPKRRYIIVPHYEPEDGHKVVGADVRLHVNGAQFVAGEGGVSRCNGDLYKYFTWEAAMGIFPDGDVYYPPKSPNESDE